MEITIQKRVPTIGEYKILRQSVGWPVMQDDVIGKGLSNTLFGVCVMNDNRIVGMGRVIGDDAIYFHIQDVIVDPEFQRLQIGSKIMEQLMAYVASRGATDAHVGLMCSVGREKFYEKYGFITRPDERFGAGMIQILK